MDRNSSCFVQFVFVEWFLHLEKLEVDLFGPHQWSKPERQKKNIFFTFSCSGGSSIQIVETAQIDINDPTQSSVMVKKKNCFFKNFKINSSFLSQKSAATHFNPVDVVFSAKKPDGKKEINVIF